MTFKWVIGNWLGFRIPHADGELPPPYAWSGMERKQFGKPPPSQCEMGSAVKRDIFEMFEPVPVGMRGNMPSFYRLRLERSLQGGDRPGVMYTRRGVRTLPFYVLAELNEQRI